MYLAYLLNKWFEQIIVCLLIFLFYAFAFRKNPKRRDSMILPRSLYLDQV